jgi:hypothetical protein
MVTQAQIAIVEQKLRQDSRREAAEVVVGYLEKVSILYDIPPCELEDWVRTRTLEKWGNG